MTVPIIAGATSQTIDVFIADSSSTTGAGLAALVYNSSGLTAYYRKGATGSATAITLATQTVGGAYSSGGFVEIDATNMPGVYRLDLPDAAVDTTGLTHVYLQGATNMAPTLVRVDCRGVVGLSTQAKSDVNAEVDTALTTVLTEGYRSTGATGSVRDLLYEIIAHLGESSISGVTKTLKKLDGATTAKTYTLNDATDPASITETT